MSFIAELKRRNVFRVGVAYAIVAWLLVEMASVVLPALRLPEWTLTLLVFLVVAGKLLFPRRWYGGMISTDLEVIWEIPA